MHSLRMTVLMAYNISLNHQYLKLPNFYNPCHSDDRNVMREEVYNPGVFREILIRSKLSTRHLFCKLLYYLIVVFIVINRRVVFNDLHRDQTSRNSF